MKPISRKIFQRRHFYGVVGRRWQGGLLGVFAFVGGLAAIGQRSPIFGLSLFIGLLTASLFLQKRWQAHQQFRLRLHSVPFFWGVIALLRAGVAFPSAIREMAQRLENPFTARLRERLEGYRRGVSLSGCLRRFQREPLDAETTMILSLLEQCQRRGMPCLPLLESALPQWEKRLAFETHMADIRRGVIAQGVVAAALPWLLWAFCFWGDWGFAAGVTVNQIQPALVGGGILQLAGFSVLWRMSCFRE